MPRLVLIVLAGLAAAEAAADSLLAVRTIRVREVIAPADIRIDSASHSGALQSFEEAVGQEARVTIYAGQPVRAGDVGPAAVVERNDVVEIKFDRGGLSIRTEGRALDRGAVGDRMRVMNLASRQTIIGTVAAPGRVSVP